MRQALKSLTLAFITMFAGVVTYAQVTTASLSGKVVDASGEPVIGAAIVAVHGPSGTTYGAVTNNDGRYAIQGMRTGGPYKVDVSCLGYSSASYSDVTLQLGEQYTINAALSDDSQLLNEVVVTATPTSKFAAVEKTGASTNISSSQMVAVPTVSRSITDIARLSPYGGNGMSFSGMSGRSSNFTVDGANFNNNFGLSDKLPGGGSPISIDAIEEMQIVISPFDVRQTNFIGGGINAITKSGTNTFKGSAYVYHQNENMHGNRIDNTELSERAIDRKTTYGFTLGGPIVKNKLFFFANFEQSIIPTTVNRWKPSTDGVANPDANITRVKKEEAADISQFLIDKYGYDPGSYTDYPADEKNIKVLARIDWNINQNHHLALRYNYTNNTTWFMPSTSRDIETLSFATNSQYGLVFANSMYSMNNKLHTASIDLNSRITDKISNQVLATFSMVDDVRGSNSKPFPFVEIAAGDLGEDYAKEPYMDFGYETFTWKNRVANTTWTVKDDLTAYLGNHKLTAGLSYERQMALNIYMRNGTGSFQYASVSDFKNGAAPIGMAFDWGYDGEEAPASKVRFHQIGVYAQDEWNVTDRLKLTGGVRFDTIIFNNADVMTNNAIKALDYFGRTVDTGYWPKPKVQISPRLGFSWDVFGNKTLKVRGGTGLFAGRLPLVFFTNMPTNSGMVKGRMMIKNGNKAEDQAVLDLFKDGKGLVSDPAQILAILNAHDPERFPTTITPDDGTIPSEIAGVDRNFKMPQIWKSSIGIDYTFPVPFPMTLTGEFTFNKTVNGVMLSNWAIQPDNSGWATFNGPDQRHIYPSNYLATYEAGGKTKTSPNAFILTNTNKGYGWVANITLKMEPVKDLEIMASYTHTVSKEVTGMPGSNAKAAWQYIPSVEGPNFNRLHNSSFNNPDRVMASVTYHDPVHNHFSIFYEGWRYGGRSYVYENDINGDSATCAAGYDLIYIPKNRDEIRFIDQKNADIYWAFAAQDKYLTKNAGKYAEAYAVIAPMVHTFDFQYAHDFVIKVKNVKNTLRVSLDMMNVGNLINSRWGVAKTFSPEVRGGKILKYEYTDSEGWPVFSTKLTAGAKTWDYSHTYGNCWYMQIGLKYMFN